MKPFIFQAQETQPPALNVNTMYQREQAFASKLGVRFLGFDTCSESNGKCDDED
ncbi:hypothetical protein [Candidatus Uabimicrobium amorphum]|uniref:Uncharacterized protein n=1 Tax=Uabimicrobium amorphum TaxID=2596890 RepID=A0A5S9F8B6_UABAM|nr:hypothetical protein [Candidatus Uabimicrobium amorphum]BBM88152.1 hypothetical protein UABAM_06568 [Candidatus Uabimicrobium amorphum]